MQLVAALHETYLMPLQVLSHCGISLDIYIYIYTHTHTHTHTHMHI